MPSIAYPPIYLLLLLCSTLPKSYSQTDTLIADSLLNAGETLYYDGKYEAALVPLEEALQLNLDLRGDRHPAVVDVLLRLAKSKKRLRKPQESLAYLERGLEIIQTNSKKPTKDEAGFMMEIGNVYDQMFQLSKALDYNKKSRRVFDKVLGPENRFTAGLIMNNGNIYTKMGRYFDADQNFAEALELYKKTAKPTSRNFYRLYNNWGHTLQKMGDYERALEYNKKALELKIQRSAPADPSVGKYYRNIGRIYEEQGNYEEALPYMEKTYELTSAGFGPAHSETAGSLGELGYIYAGLGQDDKALSVFKEAAEKLDASLPPTHPYRLSGLGGVGFILEKMGRYSEAESYYGQVIAQLKNSDYIPKRRLAESLGELAELKIKQGDLSAALALAQEAMSYISTNFKATSSNYANPKLDQVQANIEFLELLELKNQILFGLYEQNKTLKELEQALETAELAIQLIEKMRFSYQSEAAREFLNSETATLYKKAVEQAFKLYELTSKRKYLKKAFEISDKGKASILWQTINQNNALYALDLPANIIDSLEVLDQEIASLEEELAYDALDQNAQKKLENRVFELRVNYAKLTKELENHNSAYYKLKYAPAEAKPQDIINRLPDNHTALVEYVYDSEHLYIFVLSKQGIKGLRIPLKISLHKLISKIRDNMSAVKVVDQQASNQLKSQLNQLHELLIKPIEPDLEGITKLIIIPSGALHYLSFETLCPENASTDFRDLAYLVKKYTIQYAWSAALWQDISTSPSAPSIPFTGFAPDFGTEKITDRSTLPYAINPETFGALENTKEVDLGATLFGGQTFTGKNASEAHFFEFAPQSKILHLATHGIVNDQNPMRSGLLLPSSADSLEDGYLNVYEIYNLRLNADLAVISACNTGYGPIYEGEGVMSLGRAFSYAGCKGVIMSLWLANDEATSTITQAFYRNLADGQYKNQALHQAKLQYLEAADALTAHPYFWAPLVAIGEMAPLQEKTGNYWWGLGILVLVFILHRLFFNR